MTNEEIFDRLDYILSCYKSATKDSFETETKNSKKLYNSVSLLLDDLREEQPSDELFDDDEFFAPKEVIETVEEPYEDTGPKPLTMDDLIGEDDDSW